MQVADEQALTWDEAVTRRLAARMKALRSERGWNIQRLAEECTKVAGYPMSRSSIGKLESGERKVITVPEWLALSYALNVPPITLLFPFGPEVALAAVPAEPHMPALDTWAWVSGEAAEPPNPTAEAGAAWARASAPLRLYRQLAVIIEKAVSLLEADAGDHLYFRVDGAPEPPQRRLDRERLVAANCRQLLDAAESVGREFARNGWSNPGLPKDLSEQLSERVKRWGGNDAAIME